MKKKYQKVYEQVCIYERKVSTEIFGITDEKQIQRNIDNKYKNICKAIRSGLIDENQAMDSLRVN